MEEHSVNRVHQSRVARCGRYKLRQVERRARIEMARINRQINRIDPARGCLRGIELHLRREQPLLARYSGEK